MKQYANEPKVGDAVFYRGKIWACERVEERYRAAFDDRPFDYTLRSIRLKRHVRWLPFPLLKSVSEKEISKLLVIQ